MHQLRITMRRLPNRQLFQKVCFPSNIYKYYYIITIDFFCLHTIIFLDVSLKKPDPPTLAVGKFDIKLC